jgi:hypothetical protein
VLLGALEEEANEDDGRARASVLLEILLGSGLLMTLLGWLGASSVDAPPPPQADSNSGIAVKNARYISVFAHLYIYKYLRFKLRSTWFTQRWADQVCPEFIFIT